MTALPIRRVLAALFAIGSAFAAWPSHAQQPAGQQPAGMVRATHGSWLVSCDTPAGAPRQQCALVQNVVQDNRPEIGLSVMFLKPKDQDKETAILRVLAPSSVFLPKGIQVYLNGTMQGVLYFARCLPTEGCYAQVLIEKSVLSTWRKTDTVVFVVYETPEVNIGFPIDMTGFGEGMDALPSTSASFEDYAKKSSYESKLSP